MYLAAHHQQRLLSVVRKSPYLFFISSLLTANGWQLLFVHVRACLWLIKSLLLFDSFLCGLWTPVVKNKNRGMSPFLRGRLYPQRIAMHIARPDPIHPIFRRHRHGVHFRLDHWIDPFTIGGNVALQDLTPSLWMLIPSPLFGETPNFMGVPLFFFFYW